MIFMGRKIISPQLEEMAKAIMDFEGYFPGSVSERNNNPGNLKFARQAGSTGEDEQGHAIFGTFEEGWNALVNQLKMAITGTSRVYRPTDSLYEFFSKYAEANSIQYTAYVASRMGVHPGTSIGTINLDIA